MVPTLGVYETAPVTSLLEIFWETPTTGYLSDLNEDILLGSDTVDGFSPVSFSFNEGQNPNGMGTVTGALDSPFITDYFWPLSNGAPIDDSAIIMQVFDLSNTDVTANFELVVYNPVLPITYRRYRIKIAPTSNFVFKSDYALKAFFDFKFAVTDNLTGNQFNAAKNNVAMTNITPDITYPATDATQISIPVNSPGGNIIQMLGNNGSYSLSTTDTNWEIIDVNPSFGTPYFMIDPVSGIVNSNIQTSGCYQLTIKLTDAYNSNINAPTPGSLIDTRTVNICADNIVKYNPIRTSYKTFGQGGCFVNDSGTIDVWQSLLPGETISAYNIVMLGFGNPTSPYQPAQSTFVMNNDFTFSWTALRSYAPMPLDDPRASVGMSYWFDGNFTTSLGRVINLLLPNPFGIAPWIEVGAGTMVTPTYYVNNGYPNWRPATSASFSITNNSSEQSWWQALGQYGDQVVGGTIGPGQTINSIGFPPQSCIRNGSIHTEYNVIPDFTITYGASC